MELLVENLNSIVETGYCLVGRVRGVWGYYMVNHTEDGHFNAKLIRIELSPYSKRIPGRHVVGAESQEDIHRLCGQWVDQLLMSRRVSWGNMAALKVIDYEFCEVDRTVQFQTFWHEKNAWDYRIDLDELLPWIRQTGAYRLDCDEDGIGQLLTQYTLDLDSKPQSFITAEVWAACRQLGLEFSEGMKRDRMNVFPAHLQGGMNPLFAGPDKRVLRAFQKV